MLNWQLWLAAGLALGLMACGLFLVLKPAHRQGGMLFVLIPLLLVGLAYLAYCGLAEDAYCWIFS